jgi:hypothetical protein
MAFAPDGRSLVSGSYDGICRVWEVVSGKERRRFVGHQSLVWSVAFSPDGRKIASGSGDTTILLWDLLGLSRRANALIATRSDKELNALWAQLAEQNASRAFSALTAFLVTPDLSALFLTERLPPVPHDTPTRIRQLLADLDKDQFAARQTATKELEKLGARAEPAIRQALAERPSPEVRRRLESLMAKIGDPAGCPHNLQLFRAIEVLELLGSPDARKALERLADGSARSWLTQEAKASLGRLNKGGF